MENSKEPEKKKVSTDDLNNVSGGNDSQSDAGIMTRMLCSSCNFIPMWEGNYMNGKVYNCPRCGKMSLRGEELIYT